MGHGLFIGIATTAIIAGNTEVMRLNAAASGR
jgi:hypothetical protein